MTQIKIFFYFTASAIFLTLLSGCTRTVTTAALPAAVVKAECMQEGVIAPSWSCQPQVAGAYASLGVAQVNKEDKAQTVKMALYNGRIELAKQLQSQVREKLDNFALTPEGSNKEKVDNLYASIANSVKPKNLYLQETLESWTTPSGKMYIHVIAPKSSFDTELKKAVKLSYVNDQALWFNFNSKQSMSHLEKEFDVKLEKVPGVKIAHLFQVESVPDMIVGRNKKH